MTDNESRERLTSGIYINDQPDDATGRIETAFQHVLKAAPIEAKLRQAIKKGNLHQQTVDDFAPEDLENPLKKPSFT